jgi:phospholipase A1
VAGDKEKKRAARGTKLGSVLFFIAAPAFGLAQPATLAECASIVDNGKRLECFDRLAATSVANSNQTPIQHPPLSAATEDAGKFSLADHWELGPENKRGAFNFRPHLPNYLLATYTHSPNDAPYRPFRDFAPEAAGVSRTELAFQLGFKIKLLENPMNRPADLWFAYTQQSFWQASNQEASSPFRETNYQPELMAVMPVNFTLLGMKARFINLGLVHQSNGQTSTLSRSWNRLYAQLGMENGNFTMSARVWKRLNEANHEDDNPDITDYMGHGDIAGTYRWNEHEFSALTRYNFGANKGGAQLGWAFPMADNLKGYLQMFAGYGQSLIDYNYFQRTIGMGVLINY